MKSVRRSCSVLLLACMLFVVCSGSAYAISVDGYSVVTYFNVYNNGTGTQFENTLTTTTSPQEIFIVVDTIVSYDKGTVFDIEMGITHGEAEQITLERVEIINSNWDVVDYADGFIDGNKVVVENITAPRKLHCVRFVFRVVNPLYYLDDNMGYFSLAGLNWDFEEGMTWSEFLASDFKKANEPDMVFYNAGNYVCGSVFDTELRYITNEANGTSRVLLSDKITNGKTYYLGGSYMVGSVRDNYLWDFSVVSYDSVAVSEGGLLSNIIGWVSKISTDIKELPTKIVEGIGSKLTQLKDGLLEGIKNLFIPNEEQVLELRNKFEELLASRFGAVYESSEIIDDFASAFQQEASISTADNGNSISFPIVTVSLAGVPFTFGGWEVDIIPDRFQGVVDVLKVITSIVCTLAFVMAMRKRLEGVLK